MKNASKYYWNLTNFKHHLKLHEIKSKKSSNAVNETVLKNESESDASFSDAIFSDEIVDDSNQQMKFSANTQYIYNQFSNQNLFLIEAVLSYGECKKRMIFKLGSRNMIVDFVSIAGDGDCLFASLAFQLERMKIGSIMHRTFTSDLRQKVVQHISNNYDKYKQAIKGTVYERAAMIVH